MICAPSDSIGPFVFDGVAHAGPFGIRAREGGWQNDAAWRCLVCGTSVGSAVPSRKLPPRFRPKPLLEWGEVHSGGRT